MSGSVVGVGEVEVCGGGSFREAVSFEDGFIEFFQEAFGEGEGEFFGAGDGEFDGGELFFIGALEVSAEEGGGGEEDGDVKLFDEVGEFNDFERGGVSDEVDAFDDGVPEGDGAAEGMEEGEAAEDAIVDVEVEAGGELVDVSDDVAMGEGDALGIAGAAAGEEDDGFFVGGGCLGDAEDTGEGFGGEDFAESEPEGDFGFEGREDAFEED
jgi:hypothetical protein